MLSFLYPINEVEKMKTMLIAAGSEIITDILSQVFQSKYCVYTCDRGDDALQMLQELKPDILIINLFLSNMTGLEVLQQTQYTPPVILALTYFVSDQIVEEVQAAGVGALIRLPCTLDCIKRNIEKMIS